jgi:hypothetical protein
MAARAPVSGDISASTRRPVVASTLLMVSDALSVLFFSVRGTSVGMVVLAR